MGHRGHLPRGQKPVLQLGYNYPPTLSSPPRWRRSFHFHLTAASQVVVSSGAPTWGCTFIL